nr:hypothetical protein WS70_13745 [Burkholderia mayonis]
MRCGMRAVYLEAVVKGWRIASDGGGRFAAGIVARLPVLMRRAATTPCAEADRHFLMKRSANRASRGTIVGRSSRLS